jgi:hypothetical protein
MPETDKAVRVGIAGQQRQCGLAIVRPQGVIPTRPERFQLGVKALQNSGAALDNRGADLDDPPQWLGWTVADVLA